MLNFLADVSLPGYRTLLITGFLLGAALALVQGRRRGLAPLIVIDSVLAASGGSMLLGRIVYVASQWSYFQHHEGEALAFWRGGMSAPGVLFGGVAGVLILCRLRRRDPRPLLDSLAPGAAVVALFAWLGCLGTGCAYGLEAQPDQGVLWSLSAELPDLYGLRAPRVAVQAVAGVWNGIVLIVVLLVRREYRFPLWLFLHAGGDFGLATLRGDVSGWVGGLAAVQWADLAAMLGALLAIPWWRRKEAT